MCVSRTLFFTDLGRFLCGLRTVSMAGFKHGCDLRGDRLGQRVFDEPIHAPDFALIVQPFEHGFQLFIEAAECLPPAKGIPAPTRRYRRPRAGNRRPLRGRCLGI